MNYGQGQAVMVLVGERMGFSMLNTKHAKQVLAGEDVHPMFQAAIEREAVDLNNRLRSQPTQIARANAIARDVTTELSLK